MKWWAFDIALPSVTCMQPQRHLTFNSLAGLFNLEPSQLPGEYSATGHRITCRGLAFYSCHHCLLPSTHSHLSGVWEAQIQNSGSADIQLDSLIRFINMDKVDHKIFHMSQTTIFSSRNLQFRKHQLYKATRNEKKFGKYMATFAIRKIRPG